MLFNEDNPQETGLLIYSRAVCEGQGGRGWNKRDDLDSQQGSTVSTLLCAREGEIRAYRTTQEIQQGYEWGFCLHVLYAPR